MSDLREWLERWSKLETSLCGRTKDSGPARRDGYYVSIIDETYFIADTDPSPAMFAIVQAAVQAAIVARGWGYILRFCADDIAPYLTASIYKTGTGEIGHADAPGHSPALALLTAYCDSLEAMK